MTETPNIKLKKPDETDSVDQRVFNDNSDILDREISAIQKTQSEQDSKIKANETAVKELQEQIASVPLLKSKEVTGTTTDSGNISIGLFTKDTIFVSAYTNQLSTDNKGICLSPRVNGTQYYLHATVGNNENTTLSKTEITAIVYYYELG